MLRALLSILATLTQQVSALADIKRNQKAILDAIAANHADTTARLAAIQDHLNNNAQQILTAVTTALAGLDTKVDSITSVLSQITVAISPVLTDIQTVQADVNQANAKLDEIIKALAPINQNYVEIVFGTPVPNLSPAPQLRPTSRR